MVNIGKAMPKASEIFLESALNNAKCEIRTKMLTISGNCQFVLGQMASHQIFDVIYLLTGETENTAVLSQFTQTLN